MSNESVPIGNVIHVGLTSGMKSDPISEIAEYFIQEREEDLFKINDLVCVKAANTVPVKTPITTKII